MGWSGGARKTKAEIMKGVKHTESKMAFNNTVQYYRKDGTRVIRFHFTDILQFLPNGTIIFNSGGYKTKITKERMNDFQQKVQIIQDNGLWWITPNTSTMWDKEYWKPFFDGIEIKDGKIPTSGKNPHTQEKKLLKQIQKYCKELKNLEELPRPSSGDCFICQFDSGKSEELSTDHLISHLDEKYIHGSLIVNSLRWTGHNDTGIEYIWRSNRDTVVRAVRRYFKSRLHLAM